MAIYSGLTTGQAFNLIQAEITLKEDLQSVVDWNVRRHWRNVGLLAAGLMVVVIEIAAAYGASMTPLILMAVGVGIGVMGFGWIDAHFTQRRILYLVNLKGGLEQFRAAAKRSPGAPAADLLKMVSDRPVAA